MPKRKEPELTPTEQITPLHADNHSHETETPVGAEARAGRTRRNRWLTLTVPLTFRVMLIAERAQCPSL